MSTETLLAVMIIEKWFLVFLCRPDANRIAKDRWHFASPFGATKNVMPLKEAPN